MKKSSLSVFEQTEAIVSPTMKRRVYFSLTLQLSKVKYKDPKQLDLLQVWIFTVERNLQVVYLLTLLNKNI